MKRYAALKLCGYLASFCLGTSCAVAQLGDPQRPDGAQADKSKSPAEAAPFDPQRPDEKAPPKAIQHNPSQPQVIQLTLTPAPEPVPALKYELLPSPAERKPGNGATNYYRAMLHAQQVFSAIPKEDREKFYRDYNDWIERPLTELPKEEVEKWVGYYRHAMAETKTAAYREECRFNLRLQDLRGMETINLLLHDFQNARELARVLRLRARLEVSNGKLDDAIESLRQGFQLGRDVSEPELLVNGLVGIAIAGTMQHELIEIIDQPGSPNLYWALASLPRPLVDMRRGMRFEMDIPERMFPFLKDAETAQRTPEEWQRLLVNSLNQITEVADTSARTPEWQSRLAATAALMMVYPDAKKRLVEEGFDREALEKMPVAQVVAIQASRAQKRAYHQVFKWASLPYSQQGTRSEESMKELVAEKGGPGQITLADPLTLVQLLLPGVQSAMIAEVRLQSTLAATQTIEALRMHAAAHAGQLPKTLADVTIVPVPLNPATDKPFPYELKDGIATLTVPPPAGSPAMMGRSYVIRMEAR
ncbi:MAG: hypothetical protein ACR2FY_24325 [Pirellulaceae bacterium]